MKKITLLILLISQLSCQDYDQDLLEVVGVYDASVIGITTPFSMVVSADYGDNIIIEAFFDGEVWDLVEADVDCLDCDVKDISIPFQDLERNVFIQGQGYYSDFTIQLDYRMTIFGVDYDYTLVGSK